MKIPKIRVWGGGEGKSLMDKEPATWIVCLSLTEFSSLYTVVVHNTYFVP